MPRYKQGDRWSASDANYVLDNVRRLAAYHELLPTGDYRSDFIFLAVMDEDIAPGETKAASIWDSKVTPPVDTGETAQVTLDWLTGGEPITTGKQIAYIDFGDGVKRIMWGECPDPVPAQEGDETTPP